MSQPAYYLFECGCQTKSAFKTHFLQESGKYSWAVFCPKHKVTRLIGKIFKCDGCGKLFQHKIKTNHFRYCPDCKKDAQRDRHKAWVNTHKDALSERNRARYQDIKNGGLVKTRGGWNSVREPEPINFEYPAPEVADRSPCIGCELEHSDKNGPVCEQCELKTAYYRMMEVAL